MWWVLGIGVGILLGYLLLPPVETWNVATISENAHKASGVIETHTPVFLKPFLVLWYLIPVVLTVIEFRKRRGLHWMVMGIFVLSALTVYMVLNPADVIAWQYWLFHHNVGTERFMELWYVNYLIKWIIIYPLPVWFFIFWFSTSDDQQWRLFCSTWIIALLVLFFVNHGIIA